MPRLAGHGPWGNGQPTDEHRRSYADASTTPFWLDSPARPEHGPPLEAGAHEAEVANFWLIWSCGTSGSNNTFPGTSNVDWNCTNQPPFVPPGEPPDPGFIQADINGNGFTGDVFAATPAEWTGLDYSSGGTIGRKPPARPLTASKLIRD